MTSEGLRRIYMIIRRRFIVGLVASLLPAVAAAQTPKSGGTLTYAVTAEAPSTDCHAITTYAAVHVLAPHYSLAAQGRPGQLPQAQARHRRELERLARRPHLYLQDPLRRASSTTAARSPPRT